MSKFTPHPWGFAAFAHVAAAAIGIKYASLYPADPARGVFMEQKYFGACSLWQWTERPVFPALTAHETTDVCVVGAGISGLSVAYHLLRAGKRVIVLDREGIGMGETAMTSAHLSNALDEGYRALRRDHGDEKARLAADSHTRAIAKIERIAREEGIDCDFERVDGYLFLGPEGEMQDLREELDAAHSCGLDRVRLHESAPLRLFHSGPCLGYPDQGIFHPLKYLNGLARVIERLGGKIRTHTEVVSVEGGASARIVTRLGHEVSAGAVVVATNVPFIDRFSMQTKIAAHRSYVIGLRVPCHRVDNVLLWDTATPYHYLRLVRDPLEDSDILLVGGEDHRTGQDFAPADRHASLGDWVRDRLNLDSPIVARWSGQIIEPVDGIAYIGRNPGDEENVYIATGDSGHGLTHGTIAGMLLSDQILGRENPWENLYDPTRINLRRIGTYVREAAKSTAPYTDWVVPGDVTSVQDVRAGEGAILREGLTKIAVYKDIAGRAHKLSAVCPHLKGIVRWNGLEKTWDCPCHGSRFDKYGAVLNGPAREGLKRIEDVTDAEAGDAQESAAG